jgi:hypothetical protein
LLAGEHDESAGVHLDALGSTTDPPMARSR